MGSIDEVAWQAVLEGRDDSAGWGHDAAMGWTARSTRRMKLAPG